MVLADDATPAFVRLAAQPLRWRLLTALATSDHRVRDLVDLVGQPQNLVSYHLRLLRGSELVTARRSSFDARDSYYHLDLERCAQALAATGIALHPALRLDAASSPEMAGKPSLPPRVLFACTGNSARSQIAEALLRHRAGGQVEVTSAGSHPKPRVHANAVRVLREHYDIDIGDRRPQHLDAVAGRRFDYVITLCDKVREVCPEFGDQPESIHWSIPDPATHSACRQVAAQVDIRVRYLLPVLARSGNLEAQPCQRPTNSPASAT